MNVRNWTTVAVAAAAAMMTGCTTYSDFTLTTLDGRQMSLSEQKGKVVLLTFWFST